MQIEFEKWHGCRNDFLVVRLGPTEDQVFASLVDRSRELCTRDGSGVGADGIIVLHLAKYGDTIPTRLSIINSDGSLASNCGNGIRCAASSVLTALTTESKLNTPEGFSFEVENQTINCQFLSSSKPGRASPFVAVEMKVPVVNENNPWHGAAVKLVEKVCSELKMDGWPSDIGTCDIGNQHIVIFGNNESQLSHIEAIGRQLQKGSEWDGINVHMAAPQARNESNYAKTKPLLGDDIEDEYKVAVWERGAGLTQACGTGACAVAACAFAFGSATRDQWLALEMPGGYLYVKHPEEDDPITLTGPAVKVFDGKMDF